MASADETNRIERRARTMLVDKDIPPAKMEVVRSLMNNESLGKEEMYRAIIDLIENCPDKKVPLLEEEERDQARTMKRKEVEQAAPSTDKKKEVITPLESSYYIESLLRKYRNYRIFKKRYLAHRNNIFGIGIRKRLIPSKHLLKILEGISVLQEKIISRLSQIQMDILNDESVEDPTLFNYLRIIRKWLLEVPLIRAGYERIKWMERLHFERELSQYVSNFFSFMKLNAEVRESIILEVENRVRSMEDLAKEEVLESDTDSLRREKEKRNLSREKAVYDYMMLFRSFLSADKNEDSFLTKRMNKHYSIKGLANLLFMMEEALVFQRSTTLSNITTRVGADEPVVSSLRWDYSDDYLKKVGKDAESHKRRMIELLRQELEPHERFAQMLKHTAKGNNILLKSVEDQWRLIDKKHYEAKRVYQESFFNFLDALVQFFKNSYLSLLDGAQLKFRDKDKNEHEGSLFSWTYLENELEIFNTVLDEMHFFKSSNPTLAVTREEVKGIMTKKISTMTHVEQYVRSIGDCFFWIGRELQNLMEGHRRWAAAENRKENHDLVRMPIKEKQESKEREIIARPIPFYDCVFLGMEDANPLLRELAGKRILSDKMKEGIFIDMIAFSLQLSFECYNERLFSELEKRRTLMEEIKDLTS